AWSPDRKRIAVAGRFTGATTWLCDDKTTFLRTDTDWQDGLAWFPDSKFLAVGRGGGSGFVVDIIDADDASGDRTFPLGSTLVEMVSPIETLAVTPDGSEF